MNRKLEKWLEIEQTPAVDWAGRSTGGGPKD
jgi:hypothetical protein